jgi:hypothetical protein
MLLDNEFYTFGRKICNWICACVPVESINVNNEEIT